MDRYNKINGAVAAPVAPAAPANPYFTSGNPGTGVPATTPGEWWFHMITEELRKLIVDAGLIPSHSNLSQISQAVQALAAINAGRSKLVQVSASVAANALTAGMAANSLDFRNATLSSGAVTTVNVGALSITVPSGATLGTSNGQQAQLVLLVAYNAGSPVLCIVNMAGNAVPSLDEAGVISPTTISGAANTAGVIYSASAVAAGSPYRVVGYINTQQAAAGTWVTAPLLVQGGGGQALGSLQSLGNGQTWQNVTGSRAQGTTYYNTTSRPISVSVLLTLPSGVNANLVVGGQTATGFTNSTTTSFGVALTAIVPPGSSYQVTNAGGTPVLGIWTELR